MLPSVRLNIRRIQRSFEGYHHLNSFLSPAEQERAHSFQDPRDAASFRQGRYLVRSELSKLLKLAPSEIPIELSESGKPFCPIHSLPCFSISHCKDLVIVGWSENAIGVDVERLDNPLEDPGISAVLLHPNEKRHFGLLPKNELNRKYLELFVLKEAFLKLQGTGFLVEPNQVEIQKFPNGTYTAIHHEAKKNCINLYNLSKIWLISTAVYSP